jgi:Uma2 family endonuclease
MREIVLPTAKPALEWVNGRVLQKVSPQRSHALAQGRFFSALDAWAQSRGSGIVGTEWECRLAPLGEIRGPLVSDVAYMSYERIPFEQKDDADIPRVAFDAVVEVLSPDDRAADIEEKVRVYLACGTPVVFLVDTKAQTVSIRDGSQPITAGRIQDVQHRTLDGFTMPAGYLFDPPHAIKP